MTSTRKHHEPPMITYKCRGCGATQDVATLHPDTTEVWHECPARAKRLTRYQPQLEPKPEPEPEPEPELTLPLEPQPGDHR